MFGISFSELALISLVALLVLGPERLPGAARTAGLWIGRLKRSFNNIRQEVEREIGADEIRRQLHTENLLSWEQRDKTRQETGNPAPSAETPTPPSDDSSVVKDDLPVVKSAPPSNVTPPASESKDQPSPPRAP
ncbi:MULTISPECIES: Sec-independent protein translocase protein TatB [Pseudomonas]|uniref:Sec-independent protein translocase protein TatB n=1 Tax=Pseudomonas luteola TaxID=47886 RepID=A0ABS0FH88_PSELU|nr:MULTISPECIES: Sec-independent protein translocase protein TatB [Pseudomonas]ENA33102.1 twin arginine-targeting protein translocase TatB [Pseudomonas sp. HPB0071]MBF8639679.1 Sec-independent protein translocase subunit TatB [Pseudomonas zeshuii]RRW51148.1 Sec-independent protein translocase subunit TatB [Pseudomonas luteola]SHI60479.1 sec-independent protein translocase protein TatB [Pseudomonas zeshuii]